MANSLYWEDALSSSGGKQHDMPVDTHNPSFACNWGKGKYDDVVPTHDNLLGTARYERTCEVCGKAVENRQPVNICASCQRSMNAEERRRMQHDQAMGGNKRSTHIITDTSR